MQQRYPTLHSAVISYAFRKLGQFKLGRTWADLVAKRDPPPPLLLTSNTVFSVY